MGVANSRSIAASIAHYLHKEGAELAYSHLPDEKGRMEKRVRQAIEQTNPKILIPCDVNSQKDIQNFFAHVKECYGKIDFLIHSIAFAPLEDIRCSAINSSKDGFLEAMETSVYSFISSSREACQYMPEGSSIVTLSYYGGEKVISGYNMMGIVKSALESAVKYVAYDLGSKNIRVNAISAGPVKTLAASAIGDFQDMMTINSSIAPMGRNISAEEVAKSAAYLVSDLSSATTGEILHVDCGYNIMGNPGRALDKWNITKAKPH